MRQGTALPWSPQLPCTPLAVAAAAVAAAVGPAVPSPPHPPAQIPRKLSITVGGPLATRPLPLPLKRTSPWQTLQRRSAISSTWMGGGQGMGLAQRARSTMGAAPLLQNLQRRAAISSTWMGGQGMGLAQTARSMGRVWWGMWGSLPHQCMVGLTQAGPKCPHHHHHHHLHPRPHPHPRRHSLSLSLSLPWPPSQRYQRLLAPPWWDPSLRCPCSRSLSGMRAAVTLPHPRPGSPPLLAAHSSPLQMLPPLQQQPPQRQRMAAAKWQTLRWKCGRARPPLPSRAWPTWQGLQVRHAGLQPWGKWPL